MRTWRGFPRSDHDLTDLAILGVEVRFQKRAHNPLSSAAGFDKMDAVVLWLGNKRLRLEFG